MAKISKLVFLQTQEAAINKWSGALQQTEEEYLSWWEFCGRMTCSFCKVFTCPSISKSPCVTCPLYTNSGLCAPEWEAMEGAFRSHTFSFSLFQTMSRRLLERIKSLQYEQFKETL